MVGELLFILVLFSLLIVYVLISRFTLPKTITLPKQDPLSIVPIEKGLIIVFGGSGDMGVSLTKKLLERGYNVINVSRRNSRWMESIVKNSLQPYVNNKKLQWIKADVRLYREITNALDMVSKLGPIDACVNISTIKPNFDLLKDSIPTSRDGSDIFLRLPGAYSESYHGRYDLYREGSPGNEHSLFTNLIGVMNLNRSQQEKNVRKIFNPTGVDELADTLVKMLSKLDPDRTFNLPLEDINTIPDLI